MGEALGSFVSVSVCSFSDIVSEGGVGWGGLVKSDICYVKIALFVVKIAPFHSHIHHSPSSPVCVCANEQPRPNPILGRDIKDTAGRRAVAAHGELVAGLSTRNGELAARRQCGSTHRSLMRRHSPFLVERPALPETVSQKLLLI